MNQEAARMGEKLESTSHEKWLRLVAERLYKQQRDYSIANTCEEAADAMHALAARCAELEKALKTIEERWTKATRHHDCGDYERGYGQAEADIGQFARAALASQGEGR